MSKLQNNFEINRVAQKILSQVEQLDRGFPWMSAYLDATQGEGQTEKLRYFLNQKKAELRRSAGVNKKFEMVKRAWKTLTSEIKKANTQNGSLLFYHFPDGEYLASVFLPLRPVKNFMAIGDRPDHEPLVHLLDKTRVKLCLVLEPEEASIYSLFFNQAPRRWRLDPEVVKQQEEMWVLRRYRRMGMASRSNHLRHLALIIDHLLKQYIHEKVVVFGECDHCNKLVEMVPSQFQHLLEAKEVSWKDNGETVEEIVEIAVDKESGGGELGLIERLKSDCMAVVGVEEVMEALRKGQIRELVVGNGESVSGWECSVCTSLGLGKEERCGYCQSPTETVECMREALAGRIKLLGGKVTELRRGELPAGSKGLAAFLRYPMKGEGNGGGGVFV
jgi:peptide subunit release factor 1 (eRF1)